jgi:tetratricopeptide (TPR) repeat protein
MRPHSRLPASKIRASIATVALSLALLITCRYGVAAPRPADTAGICTARAQASLDDRIRACSLLIAAQRSDNERLALLYTSRGSAWRAKGDLDRALADHREAIRLQPDSAILYFNRAVTWMSKNDADRAIADLAEAIQLAPNFALAYRNRGDLLYGKGDFTGAIGEYNAAIGLNAKDARALAMRGLAKWELGDGDGGKVDLAAAMRIDVATTVALIGRARPPSAAAAAAR